MPTRTFMNLAAPKRRRVYLAALNEFARVPLEEVSIKNIVEEAHIPRGSFYRYFEDKRDLLRYIIRTTRQTRPKSVPPKTVDDMFTFLINMAMEEMRGVSDQSDDSARARILANVSRSPTASLIFNEQIRDAFEERYFFLCFLKKAPMRRLDEHQIVGLVDLLVHAVSRAIMSVMSENTSLEDAIAELKTQLDLIRYGVSSEMRQAAPALQ